MIVDYATFGRTPATHPQTTASWCSRAFLSWVTPLVAMGNEKPLDEHDVWPLMADYDVAVVAPAFARAMDDTKSIRRAFLRAFGVRFVVAGLLLFVATALTFVGPVVLQHVVTALSTGDDIDTIVGLFVAQLIQALADAYATFETEVVALALTATLKHLIFAKALRLSPDARTRATTGDIANLCKADTDLVFLAALTVHQLWLMPIQVAFAVVLLYRLLGLASLAGVGVLAVTFGVNHVLSVQFMDLFVATMQRKDERLQVVTQAFQSIMSVKLNAWEEPMFQRIRAARAKELETLWALMKNTSISVMISWGLPVFISVAAFSVASLRTPLTPSVVFTSIALFQLIQVPLRFLTDIVAAAVKARVAVARITAFLALPERPSDAILGLNSPDAAAYAADNVVVALEHASFAWSSDAAPLLHDVDFRIHAGELVVIHGPVGCGKSSLCAALLGDLIKLEGRAFVGGGIAYCAQQPWLQHATVRDNIVFGRPFDRVQYDRAVDACALTTDFASLPAGDRTEIGERGVTLSGGQQARVALARACYSDAPIVLLDAPLAAVDASVQNEIWHKCVLGLLRDRTVLLVTHSPELLASAHVTRAITIDEHGHVVETRAAGSGRLVAPPTTETKVESLRPIEDRWATRNEALEVSPRHETETDPDYETHCLIEDEARTHGRVGLAVFKAYYDAVGGAPVLVLLVLSQVLWQALQIASDFWLSDWTTDPSVIIQKRIVVYTLLGLSSAVMVLVRTGTASFFGLRAGRRLFDAMTHALLRAPLRFIDAHPIGRLVTRYATDVSNVDFDVPLTFGSFVANVFSAGCTLAVAAVLIQWRSVMLLPVLYVYVRVGGAFVQPAREIERVARTTDAPILSHLVATLDGRASIQAFGAHHVQRFAATNEAELNTGTSVAFARVAIARWFGLRIQLLSSVVVAIVALSLVWLRHTLSPAIIGLALTYVLKVALSMERIVQALSSVETAMVSPERMLQYAAVEPEAPLTIPSVDPSSAWPSTGTIAFERVSFRYRDGDRAELHDVTFSIGGGEKVGIVGRTGAGKSSVTMALFRICELSSGRIVIDGVDVGTIGLATLRRNLSIIPQRPVLFKGSLRSNLDPFDEYDVVGCAPARRARGPLWY